MIIDSWAASGGETGVRSARPDCRDARLRGDPICWAAPQVNDLAFADEIARRPRW